MKKIVCIIILISLIFNILPAYAQDSTIRVFYDSKEIKFDVPPKIVNSRTLVPFRAIFEELGAIVEWDAKTSKVIGIKDNTTVVLTVNKNIAKVNNKEILLDTEPIIINGRTLIPLRFVSESLGLNVEWNTENNAVIITSKFSLTQYANNKYSIQIPQDWEAKKVQSTVETTMFAQSTGAATISIITQNSQYPITIEQSKTFLNAFVDGIRKEHLSLNEVNNKKIQIGSLDAYWYEYKGQLLIDGKTFSDNFYALIAVQNNDFYLVFSSCAGLYWNNYKETLEDSMLSFKPIVKQRDDVVLISIISKPDGNMKIGQSFDIKASVKFSDGSYDYDNFTVESSNTDIISISNKTLKANKEGSATITIREGSKSESFDLKVLAGNPNINSATDLQNYLNNNFAKFDTVLGKSELKIQVISLGTDENETTFIKVEYPARAYKSTDSTYVNDIRNHMIDISNAAIAAMPNAKFQGEYIRSGYKYPNIKEGFWYDSMYEWSYDPTNGFKWINDSNKGRFE